MAVIKIKTITHNLEAVINYAQNGDKTDNGLLVSGINCIPKTAYSQMALTKKFFHKETGRQGYHIIQSFNGKELTPSEANELGKELAEELFGDKFQVVVCTHINKFNIHNHIVLNSVSFIDGSKYHNSKVDIALLKDKSDELCKQYDISVLNTSKADKINKTYEKRISKYNRSNEKMLLIKKDIDDGILQSNKLNDFYDYLKCRGYEIYERYYMYITVKSPYFSRNIRLERAFGEDYTRDNIQDKIYSSKTKELQKSSINKKYYKKIYKGPKIDSFRLKFSSFYRSYVRWLYKLGRLPPKIEYVELTPEYFKQKKEVENSLNEISFIAKNNIKSIDDIKNYENLIVSKLNALKGERENLWKKHKKAKTTEEIQAIENKLNVLSKEIPKFAQELKICNNVQKRLENIKKIELNKKLEAERQQADRKVKNKDLVR